MKLAWTKQLSVGNAVIDSDHRNLIAIVNAVIHAIGARDCDLLAQAFEKLESWLCIHFNNEALIARAVGFDFAKHLHAQQHSLKELQFMQRELMGKKGMWSDGAVHHFTRSLKSWMIDTHIINLDMQMKPALQRSDYQYWPGRAEGKVNPVAGHIAELYLRISGAQ